MLKKLPASKNCSIEAKTTTAGGFILVSRDSRRPSRGRGRRRVRLLPLLPGACVERVVDQARDHNGELTAQNREQAGARCELTLPIVWRSSITAGAEPA